LTHKKLSAFQYSLRLFFVAQTTPYFKENTMVTGTKVEVTPTSMRATMKMIMPAVETEKAAQREGFKDVTAYRMDMGKKMKDGSVGLDASGKLVVGGKGLDGDVDHDGLKGTARDIELASDPKKYNQNVEKYGAEIIQAAAGGNISVEEYVKDMTEELKSGMIGRNSKGEFGFNEGGKLRGDVDGSGLIDIADVKEAARLSNDKVEAKRMPMPPHQ
jgi:hypothetical protein